MEKVILMPDSFKGTMSSGEVCNIMEKSVLTHFPDTEIIKIPVADGGEGSVDCFLQALGGEKKTANVSGVFGDRIESFYGLIKDGKTAVIEMASCAGLPLAGDNLDPFAATTYGVGELMLAAADDGVDEIIIGLGGSATNDGGCGTAAAVGVKFYNESGEEFIPTGGTLTDIDKIDISNLDKRIGQIQITVMCDIDNPMYGENGAAYIFAPQKGADPEDVKLLDKGLRHLSDIIKRDIQMDVSELPGGGAAGAMGAGMYAFIGAKLKMGIDTVLDTVEFEKNLDGADIVFTGEGKIDGQSVRGKVIAGISKRASVKNVPVVAVVGAIGGDCGVIYQMGLSAVFSINTSAVDFSISKDHSKENLMITMDNIMRYTKAIM